MGDLPIRHRNHEIETLSERHFLRYVPASWAVNKFQTDYGIDLNCEISIDRKVTGVSFCVQLKGKEIDNGDDVVKIILKRSTINRWLRKLEPVLLTVYVVDEDETFFVWFSDDSADLTVDKDTFTIKLSRTNKMSTINWDEQLEYVKNIFKKRYLLYQVPEIIDENQEAWSSYFNSDFRKALFLFYTLIKKNPTDISVLEAIALSEYQLFNYQQALIFINRALEVEDNDSFRLNKASILTEQGALSNDLFKIQEAVKIYQSLIDRNCKSYSLYFNFASALTKSGDFEASIHYYKKAINRNPNSAEAWNNLGNAYMHLGRYNLELECYNKALKINPSIPETLFSKGSSMFKNFGETEVSLTLMLQSATLTTRYEHDHPNLFFWIAEVYLARNEVGKAKEWNSKGLGFFPTDVYLKNQQKNPIFNVVSSNNISRHS